MAPRSTLRITAIALPALLLAGCFDEPPNRPGAVYLDGLESGVEYKPYLGSNYTTLSDDYDVRHSGDAAMRIDVLPAPSWSGGAFHAAPARDLSGYNALTFWARASKSVGLDSVGFGIDAGASRYKTETGGLPLTTTWTRFVIPIPGASKRLAETGVFSYADAAEGGLGHSLWFDEVQYATVDASAWDPRPTMTAATQVLEAGQTHQIAGTAVTYTVDGVETRLTVTPAAFDFSSSDEGVATVDANGLVTVTGTSGSAVISASCDGVAVPQQVTIQIATGLSPTAGPPAPTLDAADVVALFSDAYTAHAVNTLEADWSNSGAGAKLTHVDLAGDAALKYTDMLFVGIEFTAGNIIDASTLTHLHVDFWTKTGTYFKVKLVDFGANGVSDYPAAGDDKEHELTYNAGSSPPLVSGEWVSLDIPLSSFSTITNRSHLAQLVFSSTTATVWVDNVYFHR